MLMFVLPWQAFAATERHFAHVVGSLGQNTADLAKHVADHARQQLHHHDDGKNEQNGDDEQFTSGAVHHDDSQKSVQHLADFEHACSVNFLFQKSQHLSLAVIQNIPLVVSTDNFSNRTTIPLLRPPR